MDYRHDVWKVDIRPHSFILVPGHILWLNCHFNIPSLNTYGWFCCGWHTLCWINFKPAIQQITERHGFYNSSKFQKSLTLSFLALSVTHLLEVVLSGRDKAQLRCLRGKGADLEACWDEVPAHVNSHFDFLLACSVKLVVSVPIPHLHDQSCKCGSPLDNSGYTICLLVKLVVEPVWTHDNVYLLGQIVWNLLISITIGSQDAGTEILIIDNRLWLFFGTATNYDIDVVMAQPWSADVSLYHLLSRMG